VSNSNRRKRAHYSLQVIVACVLHTATAEGISAQFMDRVHTSLTGLRILTIQNKQTKIHHQLIHHLHVSVTPPSISLSLSSLSPSQFLPNKALISGHPPLSLTLTVRTQISLFLLSRSAICVCIYIHTVSVCVCMRVLDPQPDS
jgi:hypothetical protein